MKKRIFSLILTFIFITVCSIPASADRAFAASTGESALEADVKMPFDVKAKSAILMDMNTGTVLYAKNEHEALPPASVTKIMTLLLIMEKIDGGNLSLDDTVTVSENAASMGGSQVYLEAGETMRVEEMLKCIVISSANDAALAMAEHVGGSEAAFVALMNERAASLGMKNTHFENVTGLDDDTTSHLTSAYDIALMSRELMRHEKIFDYTSLWTDSIRNGAFGLTNTNRLIRFYKGATGLKTGSTASAGFCISATAERDGLHLIAVIMGSDSRDTRNEAARTLLDYGFANYSVFCADGGEVGEIKVLGSDRESVRGVYDRAEFLVAAGKASAVERKLEFQKEISAPIERGDVIGKVSYTLDGELLFENDIVSDADAEKLSFKNHLLRLISAFLLK